MIETMPTFDWDAWEKRANLLVVEYDPPQLKDGFITRCQQVNWHGLRSPVCAPCARASCFLCTTTTSVNLDDERIWSALMLRGRHPKCPTKYAGVWWLRDHIQPTSLITLHDAEWKDALHAEKSLVRGWVKATTCYGCVSSSGAMVFDAVGSRMQVEVSPSGWWMLCHVFGKRHFLRIFPSGGQLRGVDGKVHKVAPGDMMRVDFAKWDDPSSPVVYAYMVERVIDDRGRPTPALERLKARARMASYTPSFFPSTTASLGLENRQHLAPQRMVR